MGIELMLGTVGLSLAASLGTNSWLARVALRRGWCDPVGDPLKIHERPVPLVGGLGVMAAVCLGVAAAVLGSRISPGTGMSAAGFAGAFVVCGAIGLAIGLWDDFRWKRLAVPVSKLTLQVAGAGAAAFVLWLVGVRPLSPALAFALPVSAACVLGAMNALNLMDGMDGLAAGVALVSALGFALAGVMVASPAVVAPALALAGALAGFLVLNWHPARLFLGDGGSHLVGALLAALAIAVTGTAGLPALAAAVLVIGLPVLDTAWTILRRLVTGQRIMGGDRNHIYDLLHRHGLSIRRTALVCLGLQALSVALGVALLAAVRR